MSTQEFVQLGPQPVGGATPASTPSAARTDRAPHPRSDTGTIVIHWITAIAMVASLVTGLRLAADAFVARTAKFLSPVLPQGEVWTVHFVAGLGLFFSLTAYVIYIALSGLHDRNAIRRTRTIGLSGSSKAVRKARWGGINVALHWFMYATVVVMTATGVGLYLGYGGWVVWVHTTAALISLAYIVVHTFTHFMYGGVGQLLRLFRPAKLAEAAVRRRRPLLVASAVSIPVVAGLAWADVAGRSTLVIDKVAAGPDLGLLLDDPAWKTARPVSIRTMQGEGFGGTGETTVEVRALRDDANVYFAFRWWDPSRSLKRVPLIKREDGWHVTDPDSQRADAIRHYEDKFAVIFSKSDAFGNGGATHMGPKPLADKPGAPNARGLHYTTDGSYIDMWQWKAGRGGMLGVVEDMHIGPPTEPTGDHRAGRARYQGGYWGDPGKSMYRYNFPPSGHDGPVAIPRLPKDWRATVAAMGPIDLDPDASVSADARWWMVEATETVPYSKELDAQIPLGTVIPGVLITGDYTDDRSGITAAAKWEGQHWTLVASRRLVTGSKYDVDFAPGQRFFLYVSAFDHNQTRHTRHMRPVNVLLR